MLNSITENAEGEVARRIHRAPVNAAYLRQLNASQDETHRFPRKLKNEKVEALPPYFKNSTLNDLYNHPIPHVLTDREPHVKKESLLHLATKGYPPVDNALRKEWEMKFEAIVSHFDTFANLMKAVNSVRKHTHTSIEDAFCALAYCDGVILETIRRLAEGSKLRREVSAVRFVYRIEELLQQVYAYFTGETSPIAQPSNTSDRTRSRSRRVHLVELSKPKLSTGIDESLQKSTISEPSLNSILSSTSRAKFERFPEELSRRVEQSRSMEILSRKDALLVEREEFRQRHHRGYRMK